MSIRVTAQPNLFETTKIKKDYDIGVSIKEIVEDLQINTEENIIYVMCQDQKITDFSFMPEDNDMVVMKVVPAGEGEGANLASTITGGVLGIVGTVLIATGVGAPLGILLIASGIAATSIGVNGMINDSLDTDYVNPPESEDPSYLTGGTNIFGAGESVPLILGRHRYYPMQCVNPYITYVGAGSTLTSNSKKFEFEEDTEYDSEKITSSVYVQQLNQMYLLGHKEVEIIPNTIKRGTTEISALPGTRVTEVASYTPPYYGTGAVNYANISESLPGKSSDEYTRKEVFLPSKISKIDVSLLLPTFYAYDKEDADTRYYPQTYVRVEITDTDTDTVEYEKVIWITGGEGTKNTPAEAEAIQLTYDATHGLSEDKNFKISFTRGWDSRSDSDAPLYNNDDTSQSVSLYIGGVKCYSSLNAISNDSYDKYSIMDVEITDELSNDGKTELTGAIDDINLIVQTKIPVFTGSTPSSDPADWSTEALSSNPAALFKYVLQGSPNVRPVTDDEIDWYSLSEWYLFCEDQGFECNMVIDSPGSVETTLGLITYCGRAGFVIKDKYEIIIEQPRTTPTQLITDNNSYNLSLTRTVYSDLHGYKFTYIDATDDLYETSTEQYIYKTGYDSSNATLLESLSLSGVTNYDQAVALARYYLNVQEFITESITVNMDWEYFLADVGDLVTLSYDELLLGLQRGRLNDVVEETGLIKYLTLDEEITMEVGKDYGVRIKYAEGVQSVFPVVNTESTTKVVELQTPVDPLVYGIEQGDIYSFGVTGKEAGNYLVASISPATELTAQITLVNYNDSIYDINNLPVYQSNLSTPINLGQSSILTEIYNVDDVQREVTTSINNLEALTVQATKYAIKTDTPSASLVRQDVLKFVLSDDLIWFIDKTDGQLYSASNSDPEEARQLRISTATANIGTYDVLEDDSFVVFTDLSQGSKLYKYEVATQIITELTTVPSHEPQIEGDNVYYINYADGNKVYRTSLIAGGNGVIHIDYACSNIGVYNGAILWVDSTTGYVMLKEANTSLDPTLKGQTYSEKSLNQMVATNPSIWSNSVDSIVAMHVDAGNNNSYYGNTPFYGDVIRHDMNTYGEYGFVDTSGNFYFVSLFGGDLEARLQAQITTDGVVITTCNTTSGSNRLGNMDLQDLLDVSVGEKVAGEGIPDGATITEIGEGYVDLDVTATATAENITITITNLIGCTTREFSTRIEGIDSNDISLFAYGDTVTGENIPDDTTVVYVGPNYITVDKAAIATGSTSVNVTGTRLVLDANKVIVPGTITAGLLEADSMNSIERVATGNPNEGEYLYSHDHITGEERQYKRDGTLIRQFTPDGGLELLEGVSIIQSGDDGQTFGLDGDGNLTANKAVLTEAEISGTLTGVDGVFSGEVDVISPDELQRAVLNEGDLTFYTRTVNTDPWTNAGTIIGGFDGTIPVLTVPQDFRIGSMTVGLGNNNISTNVALGISALDVNTTGSNNVGVGTFSLINNTTGTNNIGIGFRALFTNTSGANNVGIGGDALYSNSGGTNNVALGQNALRSNTTGVRNVGVGYNALYDVTTGQWNIGLGYNAGYNISSGANNVCLGYGAGDNLTTGSFNISIGALSDIIKATGQYNVAIGQTAKATNNYNVAVGASSAAGEDDGNGHTAIGYNAEAGKGSSSYNTAVGYNAKAKSTGQYNTSLGVNAATSSSTVSGQFTLGDTNVSNLRCNDTSISSLSDGRDKTDIKDSSFGLDYVNDLRPVDFLWDSREGNTKDGTREVGFIAQDLLELEEKYNASQLKTVQTDNPERLEADYGKLLVVAIKAIQELSEKIDKQNEDIELLKEEIKELKSE